MKLSGKVAVVTGSSRGIGRALAVGLARAGCAVVVAAKSARPSEKLPGSVYTVADEVKALGGQALPIVVDVRDEGQVEALAARSLERFGRIDVLVNSLWPVTIIESQASINHRLGTPEMWRKADILVDCVLRLLSKEPAALTGQALLDEDFLRGEGVTDFSAYACVPGTEPPRLSWSMLSG
jgi:hypothetical protein